MQIKIIVNAQRLTLSSSKIVCGTNNFIECLFDFQSSDWTELEKWALFKDEQNTYEMYIQDNKCIIPAQCISDKGEVIMSVVGRNNGKNITATAEDKLLFIFGRAFDNSDEERLTPTYLEEVLGKVHDESLKTSTSAQEAADSATAALQSEKNAKASEKAAEASKEAAQSATEAASNYASAAENSAGEASASASAAKTSETNAASSATNAQNAATTAEKIATDLGLVDEAVQTAVASAEQASNSAATASAKADVATAKVDIATTKASEASAAADTATQKADAANISATNAAQSYANADAIAAQLTEYLATKETLTAPAVDKTLLIEGAAADSKVVGGLKSDLDNYINVPHIIDVDIEKETGKAYNTADGTYVDNLSGFECASVPVNPNDKLVISGWGGNSVLYRPRFWSDTEIIEAISTPQDVFSGITVIVPIGADRLLINGRTFMQGIIVKKYEQNENSKDFFASFVKRVGVNYSAEKTVDIFVKDYSKGKDLVVRMWAKASNNLPDFGNIGTVENDGIYVLDSIGDKTIASITSGTTDFLSPSVVYAVNHADGDYLGDTDDKLTGGWHGFNNATSGATATARNTKFIVSCDGSPLNIGEKARGNEVTIEITNRLQGSNTEKQDGSGREIVEQYFRIRIGDGFKIEIDGEIRALENIAYQTYYGLSLYHTMPNDVYFVGSRTERGAKSVASVNRCGDTNCVGIRQVGEENTLEMLFDSSYDLGTQYANAWGNSCTMSSNKSYLVLIKGKSDGTKRLQLNSGDRVYWRGYYNFYPTN